MKTQRERNFLMLRRTSVALLAIALVILLCVLWKKYLNFPALLLIFFGFVLLITGIRKPTADLFSPVRIYLIIWSVTVGTSMLYLSGLQQRWDGHMWTVISVSAISYVGGVYLIYFIAPRKGKSIGELIKNWTPKIDWDVHRLSSAIIVLFLIGISALAIEAYFCGGLPFLQKDVWVARGEFGVFGIHLLTLTLRDVLIAVAIYFVIQKKTKKRFLDVIIALIFLFSFLILLATANRGDVLFPLIIIIVMLWYLKKRISLKKLTVYALIFFIAFISIGLLRERQGFSDFLYTYAEMRIPAKYSAITLPYTYISMNFENLQNFINNKALHLAYGGHTFQPLLAIVRLESLISEESIDGIWKSLQYSVFTTGSYLRTFYADFGFVGIVILPFLIGWIMGLTYYKMMTKKKIIYIVFHSFFTFAIILSFFSCFFSRLNFLSNLGVMYIVNLYCKKSSSTNDANRI